jgi:hypothetical protein
MTEDATSHCPTCGQKLPVRGVSSLEIVIMRDEGKLYWYEIAAKTGLSITGVRKRYDAWHRAADGEGS